MKNLTTNYFQIIIKMNYRIDSKYGYYETDSKKKAEQVRQDPEYYKDYFKPIKVINCRENRLRLAENYNAVVRNNHYINVKKAENLIKKIDMNHINSGYIEVLSSICKDPERNKIYLHNLIKKGV